MWLDLDPASDTISRAHVANLDQIVGQAVREQQRGGQFFLPAGGTALRGGQIQRLAAGGIASHFSGASVLHRRAIRARRARPIRLQPCRLA